MLKFRTQISFEGLNLSRTLNQLSAKYAIFDVERQGKCCKITVKSSVEKQVVAFLQERCYNITKLQKLGAGYALFFLKQHVLLPVFLVLLVVTLVISSNYCWKIEIVGDYPAQQVEEALKQCNVSVGTNMWRFNVDTLENKLATQLDAMYAVVNRKGSALYVNVVKKKQVDSPIDMHTRRDIVATASGRVTSLLCEQGTSAVKVGDYVKKGDVLIFGLRTFNDGATHNIYALGRVVLQLSATGFAEFTGTATETVQTGNVFTTNAVVLFGKSYGKLPPFESFTVERTQSQLYPLNLTVERVTYRETQNVTKAVTLSECVDELKREALELAMQQADFVVLLTDYKVASNGVFATVYGEIEIT